MRPSTGNIPTSWPPQAPSKAVPSQASRAVQACVQAWLVGDRVCLSEAFDEIVTLGYRENLTMSQIKTFLDME